MAAQTIDLNPPREVRRIARRLVENGYGAWAVGGAVRDALAGLTPKDWDLTTSARPETVRALFRRTVPVGIEHGTVGVVARDGTMYEVTTFRRDVETFGRRAVVAFSDTLEEDLERRDFTINAIAWNPLTGELRDPHDGAEDLRKGVLQTVGDPRERFAEDYLRVLRALRFAGGFSLRIRPETWSAAQEFASMLPRLSAERVREELMKVLSGHYTPSVSLQLYAEAGALRELYPELQACIDRGSGDLWRHLLRTVDLVPRSRPVLRIAALLHDVGKPEAVVSGGTSQGHAEIGAALARNLLIRLKSSNAEIDRVVHLIAHHESWPSSDAPAPELRRWIRRVGVEFLPDLFRLRIADQRARQERGAAIVRLFWRMRRILADDPPLEIGDLAIGGRELRSLGIPAGPLYGEILRELLDQVLEDPTQNTSEALMRHVREGLEGGE